MKIGSITNYYGGLHVQKDGDNYYWYIENWSTDYVEQIPQYLYDALVKFQTELEAEEQE